MEDLDGSGFSLTIPAMLIQKADAEILMSELSKNTTIKMKARLEVSHSDSKMVEVSLWYGSSLDLPISLIQELYDY